MTGNDICSEIFLWILFDFWNRFKWKQHTMGRFFMVSCFLASLVSLQFEQLKLVNTSACVKLRQKKFYFFLTEPCVSWNLIKSSLINTVFQLGSFADFIFHGVFVVTVRFLTSFTSVFVKIQWNVPFKQKRK